MVLLTSKPSAALLRAVKDVVVEAIDAPYVFALTGTPLDARAIAEEAGRVAATLLA